MKNDIPKPHKDCAKAIVKMIDERAKEDEDGEGEDESFVISLEGNDLERDDIVKEIKKIVNSRNKD